MPTVAGRTPWLVRHTTGARSRLRLFCFHFAGGSASFCRNWPRYLSPEVDLLAIQLPGREQRFREAPFTRIEPLIEALLPTILPHLDLPYVVFGHSMGALIGYELARRLTHMYRSAPILFVASGRPAPHLPSTDPVTYHLSEPEFCREILRQHCTGKLQSIIDDRDVRAVFLPQLRADFELCETYVYVASRPLECPIVALAGTDETHITDEQLAGWSVHTTRRARYQRFAGDHFFIESAEAQVVASLDNEITEALREAEAHWIYRDRRLV